MIENFLLMLNGKLRIQVVQKIGGRVELGDEGEFYSLVYYFTKIYIVSLKEFFLNVNLDIS